jgi:hypothetical protein
MAEGLVTGVKQRNALRLGRSFDDPVELNGRKLLTLRDAGSASRDCRGPCTTSEWQAAVEALMLVVESGGPRMFAGIGIMRALNAGKAMPVQP